MHQSPIERKPTIDLIIYKHYTHTKLGQLARGSSESSHTTWSNKRKSWTHLSSSFNLINTRNKKINPSIHPAFSLLLATPETKLTRVTNNQAVARKSWMAKCSFCALEF